MMNHGEGLRAVLLVANLALADPQIQRFLTYAARAGYHVVAVARRMSAAAAMVEAGDADVILVESRGDLPARLESITSGDLKAPPPPDAGRRRPRRLRHGHRNSEE